MTGHVVLKKDDFKMGSMIFSVDYFFTQMIHVVSISIELF